jgi:hypothetical protein
MTFGMFDVLNAIHGTKRSLPALTCLTRWLTPQIVAIDHQRSNARDAVIGSAAMQGVEIRNALVVETDQGGHCPIVTQWLLCRRAVIATEGKTSNLGASHDQQRTAKPRRRPFDATPGGAGRRNFEVFKELFDDFIDHTPQPGHAGQGRRAAALQDPRTAFPDFHADIHWQLADGDRVTTYKPITGAPGEFRRGTDHTARFTSRPSMSCAYAAARLPSTGA